MIEQEPGFNVQIVSVYHSGALAVLFVCGFVLLFVFWWFGFWVVFFCFLGFFGQGLQWLEEKI